MAMTSADLDAVLTKYETAVAQFITDVGTFITTATATFNVLQQKIATGADLTPEVTRINTLLNNVQGSDQSVTSAIAAAKVEQSS